MRAHLRIGVSLSMAFIICLQGAGVQAIPHVWSVPEASPQNSVSFQQGSRPQILPIRSVHA
jgi:hypothetical protein